MRAREGVRAENNFQPWYFHCALHQLVVHRQNLLKHRKALFGRREVRCADIFVLVQEIIFKQQPGLRIKISPFFSHQFQIVVRRPKAVLDFSAPGKSRGTDSISHCVHERAQALFLRFITGRVQLLL